MSCNQRAHDPTWGCDILLIEDKPRNVFAWMMELTQGAALKNVRIGPRMTLHQCVLAGWMDAACATCPYSAWAYLQNAEGDVFEMFLNFAVPTHEL